jgi:CheY-like chemotaxis protein
MDPGHAAILVVEDDPDDILLMERAFASVCPRLEVRSVQDNERAVAVLSETIGRGEPADRPRPTHILLDLKLPNLSGFEVLRWIRARPELAHIPIVILTSSAQESDMAEALRLGAQAYRVKPVSYPALVSLVRSLLATWGIEDLQGQESSLG